MRSRAWTEGWSRVVTWVDGRRVEFVSRLAGIAVGGSERGMGRGLSKGRSSLSLNPAI